MLNTRFYFVNLLFHFKDKVLRSSEETCKTFIQKHVRQNEKII